MRFFFLKIIFYFLLFFSFSSVDVYAQEVKIVFQSNEIALNEPLRISIEVENGKIENHSNFPVLTHFKKKGTERGTKTNIIGGKTSSIEVFTQNYLPQKEGEILIPSFTIDVNGKELSSKPTTIIVGAYDESKRTKYDEIREKLFSSEEDKLFVEEQADAFLGLSTDKEEVFVEEGFTVTLALYVAQTNQVELQFKDEKTLANQISEIAKKIKPTSCWEENFNISEIQENLVNIGGKEYYQYKIYQATFFPINTERIIFPSVGLEVLNYQKNSDTGEKEALEQSFYTLTKSIHVKALPEHPAKDKIISGSFAVSSDLPKKVLKTGESIRVSVSIMGEGNISAIQKPILLENPEFEFYVPDTKEYISRSANKITGVKTFVYQLIPKEAGEYNINNYFSWIYFNPLTHKYDTLVPQGELKVLGESLVDAEISSAHFNEFYKNIEKGDNTLHHNMLSIILKRIFRVFAVVAVFLAFLIFFLYHQKTKNK